MEPYEEIARAIGFDSWAELKRHASHQLRLAVNWICRLHGLEELL